MAVIDQDAEDELALSSADWLEMLDDAVGDYIADVISGEYD